MKMILQYQHYLKPHKKAFIIGVVCSLIFGISSGAGLPAMLEKVLKPIFEEQHLNHNMSYLIGIIMLLVLVMLIRGVFGFLGSYLLSHVGLQIIVGLQKDIFGKLQSLPISYFDKVQTGDILTTINNDSRLIQKMILDIAAEAIRQPTQMLAALGALIYISLQNGSVTHMLLFFVTIPLFVVPVKLISNRLKKRGLEVQESHAKVTQHLTENLDALQEIRSFNQEDTQKKSFFAKIVENTKLSLKIKKYELTQQPSMEIISVIVIGVIFIFAYKSQISLPLFSNILAAIYFFIDGLKKILKMVNLVHKCEGSNKRINKLLSTPLEIEDPVTPTPIDRLNGEVVFKDVGFQYETDKIVLNKINATIAPQTVTALVGSSGAGKSTFAKLISRFYEVSKGSIEIDGIDIRNMRQFDLRQNIASVSQDPVLFDDTIYNNIALGKVDATQGEIIQAAKEAFAHDFIEAFEDGYDTVVGERGDRLSGGQKQRVALARAFLKNAPILVLDEATSALDNESEQFIQEALEKLMKNKTVFVIAHRFSSIKLADRILVFDKGNIVEEGNHEQLMALNGVYKELYEKGST